MSSRKYIILKNLNPILFSGVMDHKQVAIAHGGVDRVRSAGFWDTNGEKYKCFGESISLGIASDPKQDSDILTMHFGDL